MFGTKFKSILIPIVAIIILLGLIFRNGAPVQEDKKARDTLEELAKLRTAINEYYITTGKFPNLTMKGAASDLSILDYRDESGKLISFANIYGSKIIPQTPATDTLAPSNTIYDTADFSNANKLGGWNYDYSGSTGEIHANLPFNAYMQEIRWEEF